VDTYYLASFRIQMAWSDNHWQAAYSAVSSLKPRSHYIRRRTALYVEYKKFIRRWDSRRELSLRRRRTRTTNYNRLVTLIKHQAALW